MKKLIIAASALLYMQMPVTVNGQAKLVEKVVRKGSETIIPYERYVLPNGLTLLIHEDHSDPLAHVDVTYHVGSAREEIGKSGFAHFFEHMMFQGSDHVEDEQHFKLITEAGGTLNGSTNRDRTNYFETIPANQVEKMLWLEADRMGFLLDAVTQKKFEVQRATVKNERGQNYDNRPYGLASEMVAKNLYPYGNPYSWLTIGYIEDLNRVAVGDLKNFFLRWYGPNNAVVTVGGDVNPKQVLAWAEKYFGPIPKGPAVKPVILPAPVLEKDRYVSYTDNYAKLPMFYMVFPTTPTYSKDEPALDCLAEILGQGNNSLLYKNLIKANKAVNMSVNNSTTELSGEFGFRVIPYPGQKLSDIEKTVRETLIEFEKRGVSDQDISKFKSQSEANVIYGLESVSGKVSQLASFYTFTGNPNYIGKFLKDYASVTKEDVMRVYNQYIKGKHAVVLSILTKGNEENKAAEDNYTISQAGYKAPDYGYEGLKYNKAKDKFDRSKIPSAASAVVVKAPELWKSNMGDIKVIGTKTNEVPAVYLSLSFKGGAFLDSASKSGTANLFAAMMGEDTKNYSSEAFSVALDELGSSIDIYAVDDAIKVQVRSLTKNLDKTIALLQERLLRPAFNEQDFSRNQKRFSESIKNALNQPANVANLVYNALLQGEGNPLGRSSMGSQATIGNIKLSDVEEYYKSKFSRKDAEIVVVGDVAEKDILSKLAFLNDMPGNEITFPTFPAAPKVEKTKVYFVDIPNAAQTEFRVGKVTGLKYDALGDYYKSNVMNYPLGASFNSRLNLYLREDKGWTYGARSYFAGDKYTGTYTFTSGIKAEATDSALVDVLRIITDFETNGISAEELAFTQSSITQSEARKYETGFQKTGFLSNIQTYDLPQDYTEKQNQILKTLNASDVNKLAAGNLPKEKSLVIVLVGDKAKLMDKIRARGFDVVELDREGKPVK
ncbi:zinc protease [Dyadobacter koreensis]|uniref:Zinc protease n=1 Tax=Dyadobacter koreensis TaxID=408657 RepID=A0A1H6YLQ3_9BACT|nr:pitrilysin family protein [Dyadobacter koreensis]SEJ38170.1 zinc protease [Dyadobacter koreensis]